MPTKTPRWRWIIAAVAAFPVAAQAQPAAVLPNDQLPADARESAQGVIVNSSEEARKDLETARNMERQREWNKAAGWYQEVLEKYRTRVVPWKVDPQTQLVNRYRGIVYQVQDALAKWPADGVTLYRARYESAAATALAEAANANDDGGASALRQVLDGYFLTDAAKRAALRLIDLHMEAGEFDAAARVGELMLESYPADQLTVERPRVLFRTALAHHLCGATRAAQHRADELKDKFGDATGTVFGKDVVLAETLDGLLKTAPAALASQQTLSPDSWPTFSGSPDRAHVSTAAGQMGAKICSTDLPKRTYRGPQANDSRMLGQREEEEGRTLGIMPVVDGNALFFQDGARVWAVGLDSGIPLTGWSQTYGGADYKGVYQLKSAASLRNQQWTLTVTDSSVFAIMGQSQRLQWLMAQQGIEVGPDTGTRLVCLERETGRERWKMEIRSITGENLKDEEKERLRALDLSGSPLVVGDNVFIVARGGKDLQFENCYVVCLDASTGAYRWSCLVASSNSSINVYAAGDTSLMTTTLSHLAYASGRLYLLTNLGAIASIDAYNGSVVWLSMYGREGLEGFAGGWGRRAQPMFALPNLRPWEYNPVFVQDGKLFVLPADAKHLFVFDAADGKEIKRINVEDFTPESMREGQIGTTDRPRALIAVMGDQLVLTGDWFAYSVDWTKYDNTKQFQRNAELDAARFSTPLGSAHRQSLPPTGSIRGRAFVTADSLFVPTDTQLYRLSLRKGLLVEDTYPRNSRDWDESEGPGNVLVTGEHVVIADRDSVDVYTDMTLARAKLDAEEAAAKDDPEPRLHYAEVMFAAGQSQTSLQKLDEAATLLGGVQSMRPGLNRQRLFNDSLTFAQKLAREQRGESIEAAIRFFDVAASAADLASEQVQYRLARARFVRQNVQEDSFVTAVKLYQEILSRPDLRTVGVVPDDTQQQQQQAAAPAPAPQPQPWTAAASSNDARTAVQAAVEAENQIVEVMRSHPEAYAPIEQQAVAAMETALANKDADKLLAIAQTYPNASVAPKAMLEAAESYERDGDARQAAHVLRQIYRKYGGNNTDRGQIIEAMVRNYLALPGGFDIAIARLQRARNLIHTLSRPLVLPDGTKLENLTFHDTATKLIAARPQEPGAALADVHVPFYPQLTLDEREAGKVPEKPLLLGAADKRPIVINDVAALVQPPGELRDATRPDRIVAQIGQQAQRPELAVFGVGEEKPLGGTTHAMADAPKYAAWSRTLEGKSLLLVWSNVELLAIDGDTASLKWKTPLSGLAPVEIVSASGLQGADVTNDTVAANVNQQQIEEQQQFINARRGQFIGGVRRRFPRQIPQIGPQQQVNAPEVEAAAAGPEQLMHVRPLGGDRLVAATSTGRVACLAAANGKLLWQARVSPRPIERLVANEDFTVVRVTEEQTVRLIVLDNYNGQVLMVRNFAVDSQMTPVNMALSPDGMLVWTLPDRICGKDLYEPETRKLTFEYPSPQRDASNPNGVTGSTIYTGCSRPGQLLIRGSQIIALQEQGRYVTLHSLEDGTLLKHRSGKESTDTKLSTLLPPSGNNAVPGTNEVNMTVRLVGPFLYVMSPRSVIAYNLDHPGAGGWHAEIGQALNPNFQTIVPTRDFLVVAGEPGVRQQFGAAALNAGAANPVPALRLRFYSRKLVQVDDGAGGHVEDESGTIQQEESLTDPTGVVQWQAAEGGVYYLANDRKLHFVRGSRM